MCLVHYVSTMTNRPPLRAVITAAEDLRAAIADIRGMCGLAADNELESAFAEVEGWLWDKGWCLECDGKPGHGECERCVDRAEALREDAADGYAEDLRVEADS